MIKCTYLGKLFRLGGSFSLYSRWEYLSLIVLYLDQHNSGWILWNSHGPSVFSGKGGCTRSIWHIIDTIKSGRRPVFKGCSIVLVPHCPTHQSCTPLRRARYQCCSEHGHVYFWIQHTTHGIRTNLQIQVPRSWHRHCDGHPAYLQRTSWRVADFRFREYHWLLCSLREWHSHSYLPGWGLCTCVELLVSQVKGPERF